MTVKIDGTNGLLQSYDYQVLTTGFTYTFAAGTQVLVAVPAATLATGTITMPSAPADGMVITIQSSQQITALTLNGNTGQSIVGNAVQISPNAPLSWVYRLTNTTWYPFAGLAGRASSLVTGTATASTSGVSIDYTGIPSWVKRITVMFNGTSLSGTADVLIQLGTTSGIENTGYVSSSTGFTGAAGSTSSSTAGLIISAGAAAYIFSGHMVITLLGSNLWVSSGVGKAATNVSWTSGGNKTTAATLDRVRITTSNGIDTFDAG